MLWNSLSLSRTALYVLIGNELQDRVLRGKKGHTDVSSILHL